MALKFTTSLLLLAFIGCLSRSEGCCREQFMQVGDACYYYSGAKKDWHDANSHCRSLGANLPSIHSSSESGRIYALWKSLVGDQSTSGDNAYWIGLHDTSSEGNFRWTDGTSFNYKNWQPGNPNNHRDEDCVAPRNHGNNDYDRQQWNDYDCGNEKFYFCQSSLQ